MVFRGPHESIKSFSLGQHTLTILRTGGGKSLIYAAASILSQVLTVVFTPQKSLMDDQVVIIYNIYLFNIQIILILLFLIA
jgi:superfamily II DNA helicase RecQ